MSWTLLRFSPSSFRKGSIAGLSLVVCSVACSAEVIDLSPFEVTGSRIPGDAPGLVVIDSTSLQSGLTNSTWDALDGLSGLHVEQASGMGGKASLYVRGGEPNSSKVLIDGMDVGNIMDIRGGSYNFNGLGLNAIDQVKILGGSRSAIHGSDALSGVISFSTVPLNWETLPSSGILHLQAGDGGLLDTGFSQSLQLDEAYVKASASYSREDEWQEGSDFEALRANLGAASRLGERTIVRFSSLMTTLDRSHLPDDSGGPLYSVREDSDQHEADQFGTSLQSSTKIRDGLVLMTRAYYYRFDEKVDSPGVAPGERDPFGVPPNSVDNNLQRYQLSSHFVHDALDTLTLAYGFSALREDGKSSSSVIYPFATIDGEYRMSVSTLSAFTEAAWQAGKTISLNSAVRIDEVEDLETVWTGRLEGVLSFPGLDSELSVSWGSGFKKPTFFALGNPLIGNPDLLPEESDLYEMTWSTLSSDGGYQFSGTVFRQEYENLIDFSEAPPPRMINLKGVVSEGITLQFKFITGSQTSIALNAALVQLDVQESDELLRNRPKWRAGFTLEHALTSNISVRVRGIYVGKRLDSSIPTGTRELDNYLRIDTGIDWEVFSGLRLGIFMDNILDDEYEELIGFPSPGIRIRSRLALQ